MQGLWGIAKDETTISDFPANTDVICIICYNKVMHKGRDSVQYWNTIRLNNCLTLT